MRSSGLRVAPFKTYSSATDASAAFAPSGSEFSISGAGAGLYSGDDDYSTIYDPGAVGSTATVSTEVAAALRPVRGGHRRLQRSRAGR